LDIGRYHGEIRRIVLNKKATPMATILCIDDRLSCLETERAILEGKSHQVLTAQDGPTGIALARKHAIDAVVLDFNLRGMSGNRVAEVLRKEHPNLPVIIWSDSPDATPESLKWFADILLHKGDDPSILLSAIEKILTDATTRNKPDPCTNPETRIPAFGGFTPIRLVVRAP
jgi:DNA-binding response OmpR family regulator